MPKPSRYSRHGGFEVEALVTQAELGDKRILQGDLEAGVPMLEEALRRLRQLTDPPWIVVPVINLRGYAALLQDDLPLAARLFAESIERARSLRYTMALLDAMAGLAGVALARGQAKRAARLLGTIEATRASVGMQTHGLLAPCRTHRGGDPCRLARQPISRRRGRLVAPCRWRRPSPRRSRLPTRLPLGQPADLDLRLILSWGASGHDAEALSSPAARSCQSPLGATRRHLPGPGTGVSR